jgi:hypothetical protein
MRYEPQYRAMYRAQARQDFITILVLGVMVVLGLVVAAVVANDPGPRLAAYGCSASGEGVLYANEEDDFPDSCVHVVAL